MEVSRSEYSSNSTMASLISDKNRIAYLDAMASQISIYLGIVIFLFGIIGNILNILILSQRSLRSNACVMIFLASSISGTIAILSGLTSRIISQWGLDISMTVRWICKLRTFISFTSRSITFWLIILATIDRWMVSSASTRLRHLSSKKNVFRSIFLLIFLLMIIHCPVLYCYETKLDRAPTRCYNKDSTCRLLNDLKFAIVTILLPLILITIFGLMTIVNIRSSQARIEPVTTVSVISRCSAGIDHHKRRFKKTDHRLFIMLFVQVILLAVFTLPLAIGRLHSSLTTNDKKSDLQIRTDSFIYQVTVILTYFATGMQFYVNTLSGGRVFRKAIIDLQQSIIRKIMCR